jgi:hypothetical protein
LSDRNLEPSHVYRTGDSAVRLRVHVQPKAGRQGVRGLRREADGGLSVRVAVTAPAEDGKANAALLHLLARALDVPPSRLDIVAGAGARSKTVAIKGDTAAVVVALERWLSTCGGKP